MLKKIPVVVICLLAMSGIAVAQSLGIGTPEPQLDTSSGPFSGLLNWINTHQQQFYRALTGALKDMKTDPAKLGLLIGLSFAYGVFHAAGPGHGKAVISSYMIANEVELKRGIILSFLSSALQGISAVAIVGATYLLLRGTAISMGDATYFLELVSYILIIAFGLYLLWLKLKPKPKHDHGHVHHSHDHVHSDEHSHGHSHEHHHEHNHSHDDHHHHHDHQCASCGHAHMPSPKDLSGSDFSLKQAWSAVIAVGLRPCSGAIIVLSFSLLNGLYLGGILSVFAMAFGTAITVSSLAILAVTGKNFAVSLFSDQAIASRISYGIEIFGALLIVILGVLLLTASY